MAVALGKTNPEKVELKKGVNLKKNQVVDLSKSNLSKVTLGLGWDVKRDENKGILGKLFGGTNSSKYDLDAVCLITNEDGTDKNVCFYGNMTPIGESVKLMGDNLTGEGDGDDEEIRVVLNNIPNKYDHLVFGVVIYQASSRKQNFHEVENAYIRLYNTDTGEEITRFNLSKDGDNYEGYVLGSLNRNGNDWSFQSIGKGFKGDINNNFVKESLSL